jgi:hypothetical protein
MKQAVLMGLVILVHATMLASKIWVTNFKEDVH